MKPTLGYASRTQAVAAPRLQGRTISEIALAIGIKPQNVTSLEIRRNRRSYGPLRPSIETLAALGPHAAKRAISVDDLARRIIEFALEGNLIDAILDDGGAA